MAVQRPREIPVVVEQLIPSEVCVACDVCCRFPEADSPLRPYFTREEIQAAIAAGVPPDAFPDHVGSKITVMPYGEGHICPAFDPSTGHCKIYQVRPLDCRIYPFAVMWNELHTEVVMGWDAKCPFMRDQSSAPPTQAYIERIWSVLESVSTAAIFTAHPQLIGAFQDDVVLLKRLDRITQGLCFPCTD